MTFLSKKVTSCFSGRYMRVQGSRISSVSQFTIGGRKDEFVETVHFIYESLYRKDDLYVPPMHIATVMFRDV